MRIIFTMHTYFPKNNGISSVMGYLTEGLGEKGYDIFVITHKLRNVPDEDYINGVRVLRWYDGNDEEFRKRVLGFIEADDVLVNVCTQTPTTDILLSELKNIVCRKKILYVHGIWHFGWENRDKESLHNIGSKIYNNIKWYIYFWKNKKNFCLYDEVTQLHEFDDGNVFFKKNFGINSVIMENAAQDDFFDKVDDSLFLEKYKLPEKYIVCVANYSKLKNQEMVLRAYYKSNSSDMLVFVGNDSEGYCDYIKDVENELKVSNSDGQNKKVYFLEDIPREDIAKFVRNSFLFLFGSIGEKYPVSIVEPMAAGVPFISTNVGVVRFMPGGIVVPINDVNEMAKNIDKILDDNNLWHKLSQEGREYASSHQKIKDKVEIMERMILEI